MNLRRRDVMAAAPLVMTLAEAHAQGVTPRRGGTLTTMLTPEPGLLQIGVNNQGPTIVIGSKMFQGLLTFSPTLQPIPVLAKSWTISPDGREYVFKLQENVKFPDGRPMTADDVIFSITKFHPEVAPRARAIFALIDSAEAPDPYTVKFTLKQAFEPFLLMLDVSASGIVP